MPRNSPHGIQYAGIGDAAAHQLLFDHALAQGGVGLAIGGKYHIWRERVRQPFYFFRCRTRTSKLTTPFWSREPTTDTLRLK
jgi:hypothetical protein